MDKSNFISMLEKHPQLRRDLFIRGFLVTEHDISDMEQFPFYGNWRKEQHGYL